MTRASAGGAAPPMPAALVLGLSPTGLTAARSLGRRGIPVFGADLSRWSLGRFSRYCRHVPEICEASGDGDALLSALVDFAEERPHRPVLYVTNDDYIEMLAPRAERLEPHFRLTTDLAGVAGRFLDKREFYDICREARVELPATFWPRDAADVKRIAGEISYPALVKPARGHRLRGAMGGDKVALADTPEALRRRYDTLAEVDPRLLVQEVIPGGEDRILVAGCYLDRDSRPRALFVGRKLRQFPHDFGSASLAESCSDPEVGRLSEAFLRKVGFVGLCGTEYKLDPRDGKRKMIEVNPRLTLWMALTRAAGVDMALAAYRDAVDGQVPEMRQRDGVRWTYLARDLQTSLRYLRTGRLGVGEWLRSYRGLEEEAVLAGDDPGPALAYPLYALSRLKRR
jgi:predicted ATP-grasp superfamily ATP-dependent carboligase